MSSNQRFFFGDIVRILEPHEKSGLVGVIKGVPGSDENIYGVWLENEERLYGIQEQYLDSAD